MLCIKRGLLKLSTWVSSSKLLKDGASYTEVISMKQYLSKIMVHKQGAEENI
jgi:hypothetical protein